MNPNIEYEKFTQEIYQELVNADVLKTTEVQHNVKLKGRSGQEHQIDVYWEYEIAGTKQKVAIEWVLPHGRMLLMGELLSPMLQWLKTI